MNKKYIPGVIVVEGKHDVSKLANLYDSVFVVTNGYEIPLKEKEFLLHLPSDIQVIVLTDKDEAGRKIREQLNQINKNAINVEIEAPKSSKKKGVAECLINEIRNSLDKYSEDKNKSKDYNVYKLGLIGQENSKKLRELIANKFNLGIVNKNTIISRLNLLNIKEEKIIEVIKDATSK